MPKKKTHGGRREGAGRPPKFGEPVRTYSVSLTERQAEALRDIGDGSLTEGVRRLIDQASS